METISPQKEFDAVVLMRQIRTVLNDLIIQMSFTEQQAFFKRLVSDAEFAHQLFEKYKTHFTYPLH